MPIRGVIGMTVVRIRILISTTVVRIASAVFIFMLFMIMKSEVSLENLEAGWVRWEEVEIQRWEDDGILSLVHDIDQLANLHFSLYILPYALVDIFGRCALFHFTSVPRCTPMTD